MLVCPRRVDGMPEGLEARGNGELGAVTAGCDDFARARGGRRRGWLRDVIDVLLNGACVRGYALLIVLLGDKGEKDSGLLDEIEQ